MGHPTDPLMRVATSGTEATAKHYSNTPATPGFVFTSVGPDEVPAWAALPKPPTGSVRFALKLLTAQSVTLIPQNAVIVATNVAIQTAYDVGTTIQVGRAAAPALLQSSTDNAPQIPAQYLSPQDVDWGPVALPVVATISGSPTSGSAVVRVDYALPQP